MQLHADEENIINANLSAEALGAGLFSLRPVRGRRSTPLRRFFPNIFHASRGSCDVPFLKHAWLISSRSCAERDVQTVPSVNRNHGERQIGQFTIAEVMLCFLEYFVGHTAFTELRYSFRPRECGALLVVVVGRFAPGIQAIETLLSFTRRAQIFPMHVDAVSAAIDLRNS